VFLDFYVAAFCNLSFTICGSHMEQVWPHLAYRMKKKRRTAIGKCEALCRMHGQFRKYPVTVYATVLC